MDSSGSVEIVRLDGLIQLRDLPSIQLLLVTCQWSMISICHGCCRYSSSPAHCHEKQGCHLRSAAADRNVDSEFYLSIQIWAYDVLQIPAAYKGMWNLKGSLFSFTFGQICAFNFVQDIVKAWESGFIHEVQGRVFKQLFSYIKKLKRSKWLWITKSMLQSAII